MTTTHESLRAADQDDFDAASLDYVMSRFASATDLRHAMLTEIAMNRRSLRAALAAASPAGQQPVAWCLRYPKLRGEPRHVTWIPPSDLWPEGVPERIEVTPYFAAPDVAAIGEGVPQPDAFSAQVEAWTWFDSAGEYRLSRDEPGEGEEVLQLTPLVALAQQAAPAAEGGA